MKLCLKLHEKEKRSYIRQLPVFVASPWILDNKSGARGVDSNVKDQQRISPLTIISMTLKPVSNFTLLASVTGGLNVSSILPTTMIQHPGYSNIPDTIPVSMQILIGILMTFGVIFGVFGNILVLLAILLDRTLHKQSRNLMILNLAVTDLLMAVFPMPALGVYFVVYWPQWNFGEVLCKTTVYVTNVSGTVSFLTMAFITFDRYFTIIRNKKTLSQHRNLKIVLYLLWIFGAIAPVHILLSPGLEKLRFKHGEWDVCLRFDSKVLIVSSYITTLILMHATAIFLELVSLLMYARMGLFLWRVRNGPMGNAMEIRNTNKKIRALKLMFAIILTFFICYFPYHVAMLMRIFPVPSDRIYIDPSFWLMTTTLTIINSSINPVLYALVSQNFRVAYQNIFRKARFRICLNSSEMAEVQVHYKSDES